MAGSDVLQAEGVLRTGDEVRGKHISNLFTLGVPLLGSAVAVFGGIELTPIAAGVASLFFLFGGMGVGVGLHRYFSHRAFRTSRLVRAILGVLGAWAWQGPLDEWVADHRRHHRFADTPYDPHSPHWIRQRVPRTRIGGLLHAHLGWMLFGDASDTSKFARDIREDAISDWCSRHYWPLAASSILLPGVVGYLVGGPSEILACFAWAGCVRILTVQHLTWAIASFGHSFGGREVHAKDQARNNSLLAILMLGEGLHSYHHVNPGSGINRPLFLDVNGQLLLLLERMRVIRDLKRAD